MNINLDMVLMIQLIQSVHAEQKLKPTTDISSCEVIFTPLRLELFENLQKIEPYF